MARQSQHTNPVSSSDKGQNAQLRRVVDILELLSGSATGLSRSDIARMLGLTRATTHRLVAALDGFGMVGIDETGRVRLGPTVARWGLAAMEQIDLRRAAHPELEHLVRTLGETAHLGVLSGTSFVYLDQVESPQSLRMIGRLGMAMPLFSTAIGRCLLAGLDSNEQVIQHIGVPTRRTAATTTEIDKLIEIVNETRRAGYALDLGENEEGVCCVAAPVRDSADSVVGAISVSGPELRMRPLSTFVSSVKVSARRIEDTMGHG